MGWIYLIVAALFEIGWPLGFKMADLHPNRFGLWIMVAIVSMTFSGVFLYLAQKTIPIGTAYIVWTGTAAVATFVLGVLLVNDSASVAKIFCAVMILCGVVGMKLFE
jgi:quaternary ammonium compound-resistance protein SugE